MTRSLDGALAIHQGLLNIFSTEVTLRLSTLGINRIEITAGRFRAKSNISMINPMFISALLKV